MPPVARVAAPLAGVIVAAVLLVGTRGLDDVVRGEQLGPGFWPRIVLVGLMVACAAKVFESSRRERAGATSENAGHPDAGRVSVRRGTLAVAIGLIVLYVALTPWLGFPLVTLGFIVAFMALGGARSPVGIALAAVGGTVMLLYLFVKLVYLPLPKGDGVLETATLAVYRALGIF